ncbi:uncharacterized protein LOC124381361 [Silurus meridionalis]|nr:uncharacterized protein LOC124381361 [Silurus meridionalis]
MRVRPGDGITLYSDCVWKSGFNPVWFRNCSVKDHPRLMIALVDLTVSDALGGDFTRFSFLVNDSTNTHDLRIKNVTVSDQGVYYCALREKTFLKDDDGVLKSLSVYHYGNRFSRLSVLEPYSTVCDPCVSEWSVSWKLVLSVCVVCVLISSLISSICVYCFCTNTTKGEEKDDSKPSQRSDVVGEDEVCYVSLDIQKLKRNRKKKKKKSVQHSDISTYSEVRYER